MAFKGRRYAMGFSFQGWRWVGMGLVGMLGGAVECAGYVFEQELVLGSIYTTFVPLVRLPNVVSGNIPQNAAATFGLQPGGTIGIRIERVVGGAGQQRFSEDTSLEHAREELGSLKTLEDFRRLYAAEMKTVSMRWNDEKGVVSELGEGEIGDFAAGNTVLLIMTAAQWVGIGGLI